MSIPGDFRVSVGDDPDYEDLTAEIYYKEAFLAMITQDEGFENLQINVFSNPNGESWSFGVNDFHATVEHAKKRLWELRRVD